MKYILFPVKNNMHRYEESLSFGSKHKNLHYGFNWITTFGRLIAMYKIFKGDVKYRDYESEMNLEQFEEMKKRVTNISMNYENDTSLDETICKIIGATKNGKLFYYEGPTHFELKKTEDNMYDDEWVITYGRILALYQIYSYTDLYKIKKPQNTRDFIASQRKVVSNECSSIDVLTIISK